MKIGIMFGNPETTTGGMALKFYCSVRMDVRKIETLKHGDVVYGSRTRIKIVKNKVAPPFKEAIFMVTKDGIDDNDAILESAISLGVLSRSGSFIKQGDKVLGQGKEQVKEQMEKDDKLKNEIQKSVYEKAFPKKQRKETV